MKNINIPVYINRFLIATTGVLYLTIFLGLFAQIVLGAFQVLTGFVLLFFLDKMHEKGRKGLINYWISVLIYGAVYLLIGFDDLDDFWVIMYILIPLTIAGYFTYVLESLKNKKL